MGGIIMKVKIENIGEDSVSIVKEMTEEQYYFLLEISEELAIEAVGYTPILNIKQIE